jgi:IS30 family transposase
VLHFFGIFTWRILGVNLAAIAAHMDRPRSCISREVSRNGGSANYRAQHAQVRYREQLRAKGKLRQCWHAAFHEAMVPLLREGWSPEQISGVFRGSACAVSHEWVYQRILQDKQSGGLVYRHLRCQKQRKKRYGSPERRGQIINRRSISERPAEVESRQQLGHWEGDTMSGSGAEIE